MEKRTDLEAVKRQFLGEPWSCPFCGEGRHYHQRGGPAGLAPNPSWMRCPDCNEQWLALYDSKSRPVGIDFTVRTNPHEKIDELKELLEQAEDLMSEVSKTIKNYLTGECFQACNCTPCVAVNEMTDLRSKIIATIE